MTKWENSFFYVEHSLYPLFNFIILLDKLYTLATWKSSFDSFQLLYLHKRNRDQRYSNHEYVVFRFKLKWRRAIVFKFSPRTRKRYLCGSVTMYAREDLTGHKKSSLPGLYINIFKSFFGNFLMDFFLRYFLAEL